MSKAFRKVKLEGHLPGEIYCGKIPSHILTLKIYKIFRRDQQKYKRYVRRNAMDFRSELMQTVSAWPPVDCRHPKFKERW